MRAPNINPWAVGIIAVLVIGSIAVGWLWVGILGAQPKRDSSCPSGYVCTWPQTSYGGYKNTYGANRAGGDWFFAPGWSTKNRFGDRAVRYQVPGPNWCLRPGGSAIGFPDGAFTDIDIGPRGKGCGQWKEQR